MVLMDSSVMLGLLSTLSSITSACRCSCASLACRIPLHVNSQKQVSDMTKLPPDKSHCMLYSLASASRCSCPNLSCGHIAMLRVQYGWSQAARIS